MAYLDSADCLLRVKNRLNRPTSDEAFTRSSTDDIAYSAMTEANDELIKKIAVFIPDAMVTAPTLLTSADSGKTYTFGTDADAAAIFALGHFAIYENLESIPDYPLTDGVDYVIEGTKIRMPYNDTRTFSAGPYAQSVTPGNVVNSSTQPTCPKIARLVMVEDTARRLAPLVGQDPRDFDEPYNDAWTNLLAAVRTQGVGKGGPLTTRRYPRYWSGR